MSKVKATQKSIKEAYSNILVIPYCDLQHLLQYEDAYYYTAGIYGWNADIYVHEDVAICTGYRPFGTYYPSRSLVAKYDKLANEYLHDGSSRNMDFQQVKAYLRSLLTAFIREAREEEQKQAE